MVAVVAAESLSQYIQRVMRRKGMDASELARQADMPESTVRPIVSGRTPQPEIGNVHKLAGPLGVSFESLCRVLVGEPADRSENLPEMTPERRELLAMFDSLDLEGQKRALRILREVAG
jgi:transcriptional regulator with XRE-family HTH domain